MNNLKRWAGTIFIIPIIIWLIYNNGNFIPLLDHFNLLIHEGGHGIFRIFGSFIYTLGGTLMQILIGILFIFYFYSNKKLIGAQISFVYLGENLYNISKYAADARAQKLPLLGGNNVYHDWNFLLNKMNILEYDQIVGYFFIGMGIVAFLFACVLPLLKFDEKPVNLNLDL